MKHFILIFITLFCFSLHAQSYQAQVIYEGLKQPWAIAFLDEQSLLVTEKQGHIALLNLAMREYQYLHTVSKVNSEGQGGLLDIALAPTPSSAAREFYFTYTQQNAQGNTLALAQGLFKEGEIRDVRDIFVSDAYSATSRHYGSRIALVNDDIYFSIGDRGDRDNGQNTQNHAASLLRLKRDGSLPKDNPFINTKHRPEIWSFGHRNIQGLYYDKHTRQLWSVEHGPRGGDEINLIEKGKNYGWARVSHGKEYWGPLAVGEATSLAGMQDPLLVYTPSIAPSNLLLYRGTHYPSLSNKLLVAALKLRHISVLELKQGKLSESQRLFENLNERIRDIRESPSGLLYFITDSGKLYHIEPDNEDKRSKSNQ